MEKTLKIHCLKLGQLQTNCYIVSNKNNCIIIDPGDSPETIIDFLSFNKLTLEAIIATHGHFDHIMAIGTMQLCLNSLKFFIDEEDTFLLKRMKETAKYFLDFCPDLIEPVNHLPIQKSLGFKTCTIETIKTPGHTPGSCSFYIPDEKIVFTGDTLFAGGYGRTDFSYSDDKKLKNSIKEILDLPIDTIIYSGHGEATTVEVEKNIYENI